MATNTAKSSTYKVQPPAAGNKHCLKHGGKSRIVAEIGVVEMQTVLGAAGRLEVDQVDLPSALGGEGARDGEADATGFFVYEYWLARWCI